MLMQLLAGISTSIKVNQSDDWAKAGWCENELAGESEQLEDEDGEEKFISEPTTMNDPRKNGVLHCTVHSSVGTGIPDEHDSPPPRQTL